MSDVIKDLTQIVSAVKGELCSNQRFISTRRRIEILDAEKTWLLSSRDRATLAK